MVGAGNEIKHIHRERDVAAARNSRRAGKLRMIPGNRIASDCHRFETDASRGIGIVERVSPILTVWLNMEAETGPSAFHRD